MSSNSAGNNSQNTSKIVVADDLNRFSIQNQICNQVQDGLGLSGAGRTFNYTNPVCKGVFDGLILAFVAAKWENRRVNLEPRRGLIFCRIQIDGNSAVIREKLYFLILLLQDCGIIFSPDTYLACNLPKIIEDPPCICVFEAGVLDLELFPVIAFLSATGKADMPEFIGFMGENEDGFDVS